MLTTLFFSVFSLLSAFTWDVVSLGVCRVLTSAGLSAMTVVAVIYLNEMYPAAVRGKYQAYAIVIGICGTPATNLLASAVVPLTRLVVAAGVRLGLAGDARPPLLRRLAESPRWYESRGEYARADAVLRDIEARVAAERGPLAEPAAAGSDEGRPRHPGPAAAAAAEALPRPDGAAHRPLGDPDHRVLRLLELGADAAGQGGLQRRELDLLRGPDHGRRTAGLLPRRRWSPTGSSASGVWWSSARPSRSADCCTA